MNTQQEEKRRFPRLHCSIPLTLVSERHVALEVDGYDLSLAGVGVECARAVNLRAGDRVSVLIEGFPSVSASVQWRQDDRFGLQFREGIVGIITSWVGDILASQSVMFREILPEVPAATLL